MLIGIIIGILIGGFVGACTMSLFVVASEHDKTEEKIRNGDLDATN